MFESLIKSYKKLDTNTKKQALVDEMKKSIAILKKTCDDKNIQYREINSREILEIDNSLDDYLEGMFVYIMYLEELIWSYVENTNKN